MYGPNDLQNNIYLWNNTEGLMGDDITFLVSRALIKLPLEQQRGKVLGITGKNIIDAVSWHENPKVVQGHLLLDLDLQISGTGSNKYIKLALPYRAFVKSSRLGEIHPELKFVHAKKMGEDSLLVEAIISLTSLGYFPWRGEIGSTGVFSDSNTIRLDKSLPEVQEMVSAQIKYNLHSHNIKENILTLKGWKEVHLMYIAAESRGERVILTRQIEAFTKEITLNTNLCSLGYLDIQNGDMQSQVLGPREILIEGNFKLFAQQIPEMSTLGNSRGMLEEIREISQLIKNKKKVKNKEPITVPLDIRTEESEIALTEGEIEDNDSTLDIKQKEELIPLVLPREEKEGNLQIELNELNIAETKEEPMIEVQVQAEEKPEIASTENNEEKVGILRESRRAKLSKYMRNLAD